MSREPESKPNPIPKTLFHNHTGGCQNYGPFLSTLNIRCRIIMRIHQGTIFSTTTHMEPAGAPCYFGEDRLRGCRFVVRTSKGFGRDIRWEGPEPEALMGF